MNKFLFVIIFLLCLNCGSYIIKNPPQIPPPLEDELPKYDSPDKIWIPGYWEWTGLNYRWQEGRWEKPRPGYKWVKGHWVEIPGGYKWIKGHWEKLQKDY